MDIDSKLTWTPHINKVKRKASQQLGLVQRTLHAAPRACKEIAYKTLVRPRLEYASTAWSPQTAGKKKQLEAVQRKAARFVSRDYRRETSSEELVNHLNWDTLETRRKNKDVTMWHKIHHNQIKLPFPPSVILKPRLAYNDHRLAYSVLHSRVDGYKFAFFVRTIPLWNGLPSAAVGEESVQAFQRLALDHFRVQARAN